MTLSSSLHSQAIKNIEQLNTRFYYVKLSEQSRVDANHAITEVMSNKLFSATSMNVSTLDTKQLIIQARGSSTQDIQSGSADQSDIKPMGIQKYF